MNINKDVLRNVVKLVPGYRGVKSELMNDWEYAHTFKSPEEFINKEKHRLNKIQLGFNFSPPHMMWVKEESRLKDPKLDISTKQVFDWFKGLGFKIGRMEIRIDRAVDKDLRFSSEYYDKYLEAFRKNKMKAIINPGLKAARWPEIHITNEILNRIYNGKVPYGRRTIGSNDPLAIFVLKFQNEVYAWLKKDFLDVLSVIQPENEPMTDFGALRWKVNNDYLFKSVENAVKTFEGLDVDVLLNSPMAFGSMRDIDDVFMSVLKKYPNIGDKLIIGVNHYYKHPYSFLLSNEDIADTYAFTQLDLGLFGNLKGEKERIIGNGIKIMTTELQIEPWYPEWKSPGNNFNEFIFVLLRNMKFLNLNSTWKTPILLWGVEEMYANAMKNPSKGLRDIMKTVRMINNLSD